MFNVTEEIRVERAGMSASYCGRAVFTATGATMLEHPERAATGHGRAVVTAAGEAWVMGLL